MPSPCIHGFSVEQCASCRTCPHGLLLARCRQCSPVITTTKRSAAALAAPEVTAEEHLGYEIVFVPAVSGFHYRDADGNSSPLSYRSAFLARRAVAEIVERAAAKASRAAADNGS